MIRATLYLLVSAVIWLVEGFLFSRFLGFAAWQVVLMAAIYIALFLIAAYFLYRFLATNQDTGNSLAAWRQLALAPMITLIVGSFCSLPLLLLILALGKIE